MKTEKLILMAEELNKVLGLEPKINIKAPVPTLTAKIKKAFEMIMPEDNISEDTIAGLREMGLWADQDEAESVAKEQSEAGNDATANSEEETEETESKDAPAPKKKTPKKKTDKATTSNEVITEVMEENDFENEGAQILVLRDNARAELAQIKTIENGIDYLHKVQSISTWIKAEKKDAELQNIVAEQKLRTQRILGSLIKLGQEDGSLATQKIHGKGIQKTSVPENNTRKTLDEIGISRNQSSTFQQIADIPEDKFESFINEKKQAVKEAAEELTTRGVVAFAKQLKKPQEAKESKKAKLLNKNELIELASGIIEKYNKEERHYLITLLR